jgi:response regulator RpfG family c-di-GMP phosphodiesterase
VPIAGEDIPIAARITALADVYDALCSRRVYKEAWPEEEVLQTILEGRGTQFDPDVVDAFMEIQDVIRAIRAKFQENKD